MRTTSFLASLYLAVATFSAVHATKSSPYPAFAVPRDCSTSNRSPSKTPSAWTAVATASLAIALATATPALAADADLRNGAVLFAANCAGCHAGGQKFVQTGMPHKFMPLKFSDQDYKDVTSYVLNQALGDKW
jgi:mono/diheme cytochrome c family protein